MVLAGGCSRLTLRIVMGHKKGRWSFSYVGSRPFKIGQDQRPSTVPRKLLGASAVVKGLELLAPGVSPLSEGGPRQSPTKIVCGPCSGSHRFLCFRSPPEQQLVFVLRLSMLYVAGKRGYLGHIMVIQGIVRVCLLKEEQKSTQLY